MTICMSCGRRTDPNRSFCPHCGSAVFVESSDPALRTIRVTGSIFDPAPTVNRGPQRQAPQRVAQRARQQVRQATPPRSTTTTAPGAGSALWSLIKLGIFLYIVYRAYLFLSGVPEVRSAVQALQNGEQADFDAAGQAITRRFQDWVLESTGSPASSSGRARDERNREPDTPAPPPSSPAAASREPASEPASERATAPASPGFGASTTDQTSVAPPTNVARRNLSQPAVIKRVAPQYTPEALRARVQGTVLLRGFVEPDGTVTNVSVLRSLDKEFGLDEQAMMALRQWIFDPAQRNGVPSRAVVQVEMHFRLSQ